MLTIEHRVGNGDGWDLALFQSFDEARLDRARRPVLIVPGYGMNSFIFSFHPHGHSLVSFLAHAGFEVWRADLREQGGSRSTGGTDRYGLVDLATTDVSAAISAVLERRRGRADRVDLVGASLGGTLVFAHLALAPRAPLGALVALGSPVRWVEVHPILRVAFASERLASALPIRGTRAAARFALPLLAARAPTLLSVYMNPRLTDTRAAVEMARTVEDPNRYVNGEIARWIRDKDLVLRGVNVTRALPSITAPFLCVSALGDGIVPPATAGFAFDVIGSTDKTKLDVEEPGEPMSHADLFVSRVAEARVFEPLSRWLAARA